MGGNCNLGIRFTNSGNATDLYVNNIEKACSLIVAEEIMNGHIKAISNK